MPLFAKFQQQLTAYPPSQAYLVALSGGVDSMVLLHLLHRTQHPLRAIHIHHGLSPNADNWVQFCANQCEKLGVSLIWQKVNVDAQRNLEANARAARYQAIANNIAPQEILLTAHHLDDQVETFFLALKRGAGVKGLAAMQAVSSRQNFTLFRPLLPFTKAEILVYAKHHQLVWVNDESNQNSDFDRNFLRQKVLPQLSERWQHFPQQVASAVAQCQAQQTLIEELLTETLQTLANIPKKQLNIATFPQFSRLKQQQLLRLWLAQCGCLMPSQIQLNTLIDEVIFAQIDKQPKLQLGKQLIRRYQQHLWITEDDIYIEPSRHELLPLATINIANWQFTRQQQQLICQKQHESYRLLLPETLMNAALTIVFGQQGKVKQYGKPQREEMKKIWQASGIPPWERANTPLLFWQDELVYVLKSHSHNVT